MIGSNTQASVGDIYWLTGKSDIAHPHVVVAVEQGSAVLCQITTNMAKANLPGNIMLNDGEGGLDKQSIVEATKQVTLPLTELGDVVGKLTPERIAEIHQGMVAWSRERAFL